MSQFNTDYSYHQDYQTFLFNSNIEFFTTMRSWTNKSPYFLQGFILTIMVTSSPMVTNSGIVVAIVTYLDKFVTRELLFPVGFHSSPTVWGPP